jgi:hypothetical protein
MFIADSREVQKFIPRAVSTILGRSAMQSRDRQATRRRIDPRMAAGKPLFQSVFDINAATTRMAADRHVSQFTRPA